MKKGTKLSKKQKGFVKDYVETGNGVKSALKNYDTDDYNVANQIAIENLQKPTIQKEILSIAEQIPDELLVQRHKELLNSTNVEHMVYPPFRSEKERKEIENTGQNIGEQLTDIEIIQFYKDINCEVRRIVHGDMARHVYFWSADNKARKDAIDMAYKLKGQYAPEKLNLTGSISISDLFDKSIKKEDDHK